MTPIAPALPAVLRHPEFYCPRTGLLLTDPVIDAHGQSYQRGQFVDARLVPGTGVDPSALDGPVMDDVPTRTFVADMQAAHPQADDAFLCPILYEASARPVLWRGAGLTEQHVFDADASKRFFAAGPLKSPVTRSTLPAQVWLRKHAVATAYAARIAGCAGAAVAHAADAAEEEAITRGHAGRSAGTAAGVGHRDHPWPVPPRPLASMAYAVLAGPVVGAALGVVGGLFASGGASLLSAALDLDCLDPGLYLGWGLACGGFAGTLSGFAVARVAHLRWVMERSAILGHNARFEQA